MEEKKAGRIVILAGFIIIICLSGLFWLFAGRYLEQENHENRRMAEFPTFSIEKYDIFAAEFSDWFNDNMPFRSSLISIKTKLDYSLFGESINGQVIIGDDNWLFYANAADGNPLGCYLGTNLFTEEELTAIADNCVLQRDFLESQGKEFVIFIAPNKERIYYEHMPKRYGEPAEEYRARQVIEYLRANTDLRIVYPYGELMEVKEKLKEPIWYKADTHWNYLGGYIGASALLKELGIEMPPIDSENITILWETNIRGIFLGS